MYKKSVLQTPLLLQVKEKIKRYKRKKGTNLIELIGVMVVIVIIAAIAVGGILAARDNAYLTSAQSDLKTYQTTIQQVLMSHPELAKYADNKPNNSIAKIVDLINEQLEEDWKFELLPDATTSGAVAGSEIKRDPWNNPYGLYVYTNTNTTKYNDESGNPLKATDSSITFVVASAGKNSTGGPVGYNGDNYDATDRTISSASAMVNNSDGIDDIGVIIRTLNGNTRIATFGFESADLGKLEKVQWIYGVPNNTKTGICYDFLSGMGEKTPSMGGSLNQYYDLVSLEKLTGDTGNADAKGNFLAGTWD